VTYPDFEIVILYGPPGFKLPTEKTPFSSDDVVLLIPVATFVTTTVAWEIPASPLRAEVVSLEAYVLIVNKEIKKKLTHYESFSK